MATVTQYLYKNRGTIVDFTCCTALTYGSAWYFNKSMRTVLLLQIAMGISKYLIEKWINPLIESNSKEDFKYVIGTYARINASSEEAKKPDIFCPKTLKKIVELSFIKQPKLEFIRSDQITEPYTSERYNNLLLRILCSITASLDCTPHVSNISDSILCRAFATLFVAIASSTIYAIQFAKLANISLFTYECTSSVANCALKSVNYASTYFAALNSVNLAYKLITNPLSPESDLDDPINLNGLRSCIYSVASAVCTNLLANSDYYLLGRSFNSASSNFIKFLIAPYISSRILGSVCSIFQSTPDAQAQAR